ncbi:amidinotransferase [Pectobacterium colocasium]|uniref:amidinotransferase n=1 Tax=Pectobacterium colocasium TaxID=2878098 RepID=UPI001CD42017|nr:amidinotransferase [Pectobacterium colocasium]
MDFQKEEPWFSTQKTCPVEVYTEWDPLEEIIVGDIDDIRVPEWDPGLDAVIPKKSKSFFKNNAGGRFPKELITLAKKEVNQLADILQSEGIRVRRPEEVNHHKTIITPHFSTGGGFYSAMPRDCLFAIGKKIIEVPMAWRSRYFETFAFREILNDYFSQGAEWLAAPKPMLKDSLWKIGHDCEQEERFDSIINESEPVFDAADFMKMGKDIIGQRSHVTNQKGVEWLRRALGDEYRIHIYEFDDASPMHIDTTILPLAPGRVLVNKAWVSKIPDIFKDWEILTPPPSMLDDAHPLFMTSKWIHTNVLMLDDKTVVVEKDEELLKKAFNKWGFKTILCPFKHFQTFGGSFHCATLDVKRSGSLKSYV